MKLRYLVIALSVAAVVAIGLFGIARAAQRVTLASGEAVNGPYIHLAERIEVRGMVDGDVIVAGSEVVIDGMVKGNVYAAGSRVEIAGKVGGNVHVVASDVRYAAETSGSIFAAGSLIDLQREVRASTLYLAGSQINAQGKYSGSIYAAGSEVTVGADVARDLNLTGSQIRLTRDAQIGGSVKYASNREAVVENDKAVQGSISRVSPPRQSAGQRFVARLTETLFWLAANLLLAAVLLKFAPRVLRPAEAAYRHAPLPGLLRALAFVFLVPVGLILAAITVVGLPLALILALAYILILLLAPTAAAYWLGVTLFRWQKAQLSGTYTNEFLVTAIGILLLSIIGLIPVVGGTLSFAAFLIGVAILIARDFKPLGWRPARKP